MNIKKIINKKQATIDELFTCLEEIKNSGDIFILKMDGERENNQNTIMITFPKSNKEMIRHDGESLKVLIKKALSDYIRNNN
ncbi:hypothetical protein SAMN04487765_1625 [Tenacibaculum sp. MAR_2010_89]|uniref:hypothetical protein n=1 Tax=Tenacibaculum sp. MAR_2010_89 TaxID=1250198 RepID=UPI00089D5DF2|nr:hypothetical protein [Tenacibaculum sp. MAR_2010_89]SEE16718.1 hypothetical protein SAMN04487765_1625 [Tenacibaculum sp. MAR_2010_89]